MRSFGLCVERFYNYENILWGVWYLSQETNEHSIDQSLLFILKKSTLTLNCIYYFDTNEDNVYLHEQNKVDAAYFNFIKISLLKLYAVYECFCGD